MMVCSTYSIFLVGAIETNVTNMFRQSILQNKSINTFWLTGKLLEYHQYVQYIAGVEITDY